jgi:hypothetical protein
MSKAAVTIVGLRAEIAQLRRELEAARAMVPTNDEIGEIRCAIRAAFKLGVGGAADAWLARVESGASNG